MFGVWATLVAFILRHHEPWADESQAWLIARDLDLKSIWFYELRYEGTPGLWHTILWVAQHVFHATYGAMGVIGAIFAAMGAAFILWKAPFPRPLRYLLVFSYVIVYQYAVVARSYNLLPLLVFAAAYFYGDCRHPVRMTAVLILLANVAVHGTVIAACLGLGYLIQAIKEWPKFDGPLRNRYVVCIAAMLLAFLFLFIVLKPTPDVLEFVSNKNPAQFHRPTRPALSKLPAVLAGAFLDQPALSALFLILAGGWCFMRRKLLPFALPVSLLLLLFVTIHGRPHHHGTVFLAAIAGLWIAWPSEEEKTSLSAVQRQATLAMVALLACLLGLNVWDAAVCMRNDYRYPYSGSEDAARYLKSVGADKGAIFGYRYGMSAVQAYFERNILTNIPTTYCHEGLPLYGFSLDLDEIQAASPQYLILFSNDPETDFGTVNGTLNRYGYHLAHFSDGTVFYKRTAFDAAAYFIYRRDGP